MEQDFEKILNKLVASTRSPRGKFSKANSWILLEKRLPRLQRHRHILSLRTMASAAAVAVLLRTGMVGILYVRPGTIANRIHTGRNT